MPSIPASLPTRRLIAALGLFVAAACMPAFAQTHPGQDQLVSEVARDTGKSSASLNALLDGAKKQQSILFVRPELPKAIEDAILQDIRSVKGTAA